MRIISLSCVFIVVTMFVIGIHYEVNTEDVNIETLISEVSLYPAKTFQDTISGSKFTEDFKYLLQTIVGEAQYCSYEHQLAVGSVVLNRVNSQYFNGDTIKEIVLAPKQYKCFEDGNAYRYPTQTNIEATKYLLENGSTLPDNVVYQAEYEQGSGVYMKINNTYFCYM